MEFVRDDFCRSKRVNRDCAEKPGTVRFCSETAKSHHRGRRRSWTVLTEHSSSPSCAHLHARHDLAFAPLAYVEAQMKRKLDAVISNSFGFGGTNVSLVFSRV